MSQETEMTTLEECLAAGGARLPEAEQVDLEGCVKHFLEVKLERPEGIEKKSQKKQAELEKEMRGFYRAQEKLREILAMGGVDAIAHLADVRIEGQQRPRIAGGTRAWLG